MTAKVISGDLLKVKTKYICHQCNCCTLRGAHLARTVFDAFPYADIYSSRQRVHWKDVRDKPGSIIVRGNGSDQRYVINILSQYFPGKPKFADSKIDGYGARQDYFRQCLGLIADIDGLESIAFPWRIACGAAGGDWNMYQTMIDDFANNLSDVKVVIVKRDCDS